MTSSPDVRAGTSGRRAALVAVVLASSTFALCLSSPASAAPDATSLKEASTHFEHGVQLYNEADYRASLVEFKRAYQLAPNPAVLYNVGETQYQLQNYAAASSSLEQYLSESGPGAAHRAEVEQTLQILKARVGRLDVQTGETATITVDDEVIGSTPFASPPRVSIGHRKVTAIHEGQAPVTQYVDIAAGETAHVRLNLVLPSADTVSAVTTTRSGGGSSGAVAVGLWIGTGALAVGSIVTGVFALHAGSTLSDDRNTFGSTRSTLDSDASKTKNLSIVADVLGGAAALTGVAALVFTFKAHGEAKDEARSARLQLGADGASLQGTF